MKLVFYPVFNDSNLLTDHYFRLHWYLSPFHKQIEKIVLPRRSDDLTVGALPEFLDESLPSLEGNLPVTFQTVKTDADFLTEINEADCVLLWSVDEDNPHRLPPELKGKRVIKIDHRRLQFAGSFYLKFPEAFEHLQDGYIERSQKIFERINKRCTNKVGYIFGTGPGLAKAKDTDFSDGVSIACNSMVRNHELLDRLKPPLIVVADPIFHAGPSSYAAAFRKELIRALDRYDADLIVPMRDYHIYLHHLPKRFTDRIAAVPFKTEETPNLDLSQSFHVTSTGNVLTLFLLPLAATFFKEIRIYGCDGRPLEANSYFWSHDKASQFNDKMGDIQIAHPAFFDIDYDDYYQTHCKTLDAWINAAETRGKRITNNTPSYIPALAKRTAGEAHQPTAALDNSIYAELISVDPDALSNFGHYLSYDYRLGEDATQRGLKFSIIGNKNFELEESLLRFPLRKALSVHSWVIGNRPGKVQPKDVETFSRELKEALVRRQDEQPDARAMLYMYCGSLEHAEIFEDVLTNIPDVDANINLFWTSFVDYRAKDFIDRWKPVLDRILKSDRITLTVPTTRLQKGLLEAFALRLPVAPHPSSTLSDKAAAEFLNVSRQRTRKNLTVLFPGGMRADKGFDLTVEAANRLSKSPGVKCLVRARPGPKLAPMMERVFNTIEKKRVQISTEDVSDDKFASFLTRGDIIVLPYRAPEFSERTSGLLIDAILLGLPVVVLRDTWLGDVVEQGNVGTVAFDDADNFATAIQIVIDNYPVFIDNVETFRKNYLRKNSWRALADSILNTQTITDTLSVNDPKTERISGSPDEALKTTRDALIQKIPKYLRSPIFLPTDKISLPNQIEGLKRVIKLYDTELDERYRPKLEALKASRRRRRCFVIGNGPSLKKTDLSRLKGEDTFATNGFFLKMPDLDWAPTYYVVEDHLVAEDRAREINALRGSTKLFPASLRYILGSDQDTIYFDHRPRISFPKGFDFSFDAHDYTYAGGTVTFTCLELAAYLGYEEIYLIGVDADYAIPADATLSGSSRVKEIDMQSDDKNHFHPDYFGKGKRWHEPNVNVMLEAYKEAKHSCDTHNIKITNATIGGKLEVFPRIDFNLIFPELMPLPRLLIIDQTPTGDGTATGELKASLFHGWPQEKLLQLYDGGNRLVGILEDGEQTAYDAETSTGFAEVNKRILDFNPQAILYRPVPHTGVLHGYARDYINRSKLPLITWVMDDWPTAYAKEGERIGTVFNVDWRNMLRRSRLRLCIGDTMAKAFTERYGLSFDFFANGVDPTEWAITSKEPSNKTIKVRFAGSLAENMTRDSVVKIAEAVENLANEGIVISFEIKTRLFWQEKASQYFETFKHTKFYTANLSREKYRSWMSGADIIVIAYNFDDTSREYVRYSIANKLPECLACGAALLALGPSDIATMALLEKIDCGIRVTEDNPAILKAALAKLASAPQNRAQLAAKCQETAFEEFNINTIRHNFQNTIAQTVTPFNLAASPRSAQAHVDETAVVAKLLETRRGRGHIMVDVGAHFGTSAYYFHNLGWTIHCYEPDVDNRSKLSKRFTSASNVTIDPRAVSDKPATGVSFFTSEESTGISGLSAFRPTHKESARVDITTVVDIINDHDLKRIDFLKIDVEGFDFSVLKGVPWDHLKPEVIECEFEDAKTVPLGHNWRDIANYLHDRGYTVYISEWHPIVRYGIRHDWCRVIAFDETNIPDDAWGNLLAFKTDPGLPAIRQAFSGLIKSPSQGTSDKTTARPFYAKLGESLRQRAPRIFSLLRFARRAVAGVWRRRKLAVLALAILALPLLASLHPIFADYRALIWGGIAFAAAIGTTLIVALWSYLRISALTTETAALRASLGTQKREAAKLIQSYSLLRTASERLDKRLAITRTELDKVKLTVDGGFKHAQTEIIQATNTAKDALQILENESSANRAITVGLDIVSAMRAIRPLWSGENAVELLMQHAEIEHGHALMMAALIDLERQQPGTLKGRTLIEIGATRERAPAQKSTEKLAIFTAMTGMKFIAVDMDPINIKTLKPILRFLNPTAQAVAEKGEEFLATYTGPIDYVYLDAFDFYHDNHSETRQARYRKLLDTEINDQECWRMHLRCAELLVKRLPKDGVIVFDDTWTDDEGHYAGKGKSALPLLLKNGFHVIAATRATVALVRKPTDAP